MGLKSIVAYVISKLTGRYLNFRHRSLIFRDKRKDWLCKIALRLIYPRNKWLTQHGIDLLGAQTTRRLLGFPQNKKIKHRLDCFDPDCTIEPEKPLKIAVCLSGETRTLDYCLSSQQRFFHGHEVDYFCHLWEDNKIPESLSSLKNSYLNIEPRREFNELEIATLKSLDLEHIDRDFNVTMVRVNMFPMWYGVKRAYQTIEESGKNPKDYDLICRSRYDILLLGCLGLFEQRFKTHQLAIDYTYSTSNCFGDQWAIGTLDAMLKYCHLFNWFSDVKFQHDMKNVRFDSEGLLKHYLTDVCKLKVTYEDIGVRIMRDDFIGMTPHRIPIALPSFFQKKEADMDDYVKQKYPDIHATKGTKYQPEKSKPRSFMGIRWGR